MIQMTEVWTLTEKQQDALWAKNECPMCKSKITDRDMTMDYAIWRCECSNTYYVD